MAQVDIETLVVEELLGNLKTKPAKKEKVKEVDFLPVEDEKEEVVTSNTMLYSQITGSVPIGKTDFAVPAFTATDWDEDGLAHIPAIDESFVWDHSVAYPLLKAYALNKKVLIVGPTGCGKTEIVRQLAAHTNHPYLRINGRQDMESDTLLGKPWVSGGEMHFELGELPKALKRGWMIAFDEPWKTPAGIQMALQRYYEKDGILQLDDMPGDLKEKTIVPDKRSRLVLCDNVVGTGDNMDKFGATLIQDSSTINRIDLVLRADYLNLTAEIGMLTGKYKWLPEEKAKKMVQMANLIRKGFEQSELSATISPRNLMSWAELSYNLKNYAEAFEYTMLNRFAEDSERAAVKHHWTTVFGESL